MTGRVYSYRLETGIRLQLEQVECKASSFTALKRHPASQTLRLQLNNNRTQLSGRVVIKWRWWMWTIDLSCRNFLCQSSGQSSRGKYRHFLEVPEFRYNTVTKVERSTHAKNQPDSFSCFDRTPTCHRQTQTDGHGAMATTRTSIASRG